MSSQPDVPWNLVESYMDKFSARSERRVLGPVEHVLAQETVERNKYRDTEHLHPSSLSKNDWCPRATYYDLTNEEESNPQSFSLSRLNVFSEGHNIHDKWQRWLWKTGNLIGNWQCNSCGYGWMGKSPTGCPRCPSTDLKYKEVPIFNEEYHILGHADGEWEDDRGRALIEVKSVGLGTIRWDAPKLYEGYANGSMNLDQLWDRIKRPLKPHLRQINLYMFCRKIDNAIVIYEFKANQAVKEFHVSLNMDLVQPMLDGAKQVLDALETCETPPRPLGFMKSKQCKFCPFKDRCWNGA